MNKQYIRRQLSCEPLSDYLYRCRTERDIKRTLTWASAQIQMIGELDLYVGIDYDQSSIAYRRHRHLFPEDAMMTCVVTSSGHIYVLWRSEVEAARL